MSVWDGDETAGGAAERPATALLGGDGLIRAVSGITGLDAAAEVAPGVPFGALFQPGRESEFERAFGQALEGAETTGRATLRGGRCCRWRLTPLPAGSAARVLLSLVAERPDGVAETPLRYGESPARACYEQWLLRLAFDIVVVECEGLIAAIDPDGARLLGVEPADALVGRPLTDLYAERYHRVVLERIEQAHARGGPMPLAERELVRRDGSVLEVEAAAIPIRYRGCPATRVVFRDVSQRKRAEAALHERDRDLAALARVVPVGIFQADVGGGIRYVNTRLCEITGRGASDLHGEQWLLAVHPQERAEVGEAWRRAVRACQTFRRELRVVADDGTERWALLQAIPERVGGEVVAFVGSVTDITRSKRAEEELRRYRGNLEELVAERTKALVTLNRELESFSYSVSHDLRAPLRAINGFSSALWEDHQSKLDEDALFYIDRIRSNTQRMSQLIDDLLALSRVNRHELRLQSLDLTALAQAVEGELREGEPSRRVEVTIVDGMTGEGDPTLLRMVLHNLLANAWKYTSQRPDARIQVGCYPADGAGSVYYVKDNGVGFDAALADQLFEPFRRLHDSTHFEGSGVGLATVQRIVHRHGGEVWAEGAEGVGATVFFTLAPAFSRCDPLRPAPYAGAAPAPGSIPPSPE